MKIIKVIPFGYCAGVVKAMDLALAYAKDHPEEQIYLLGMLVHNEDSVLELTQLGVHVLDEKKAPLLEQLKGLPDGVTVIFSAHGHPSAYEDICAEKHIKTIDTTCVFVRQNHFLAMKEYQQSEDIIYIGSKGHLESEGFIADLPKVSFYDVKSKTLEIKGELHSPKLYAQTTLGKQELEAACAAILSSYPNATLIKGRCHATSQRQEALISAIKKHHPTCLIVLGSATSNNSKKLAEIGESMGVTSHLCLNLLEVKQLSFAKEDVILLCSGASTSRERFLEVERYLSSLSASQR